MVMHYMSVLTVDTQTFKQRCWKCHIVGIAEQRWKGKRMQITIDLLSLFIGLIFGLGLAGLIVLNFYYDDKWDAAFSVGWKCGNEYQKREQNNE